MKPVSIFKAITLILVFCIADIYVLADARKPDTSGRDIATTTPADKVVFGRLDVPYRQSSLVNGRPAESGETITSGSHLQTGFIKATVQIRLVGELDIEPNTNLLLTFDQRSVEVKVLAGNATLSTSDGVKGRVIMPDGETCPSMAPPSPPCAAARAFLKSKWFDILLAAISVGAGYAVGKDKDGKDCFLDVSPATVSPIRGPTSIPWPCNGLPKGTHLVVN